MGMCAGILAIGPFSEAVRTHLDYPAGQFANTRPGVPVLVHLFGIVHGSTASRAFAAALGISDAWDFNQHVIDRDHIDFEQLRRVFATLEDGDDYLPDLDRLRVLRDHGFVFYFEPNG